MAHKISFFKNVKDTKPKTRDLDSWLKGTIEPTEDLKNLVLKYRATKFESQKRKLPCVTISATFKKERNLDSVKKTNPFIVLDIDRSSKAKNKPSNTCIDMFKAKAFLSKHPSTYFCGFSVGNDGVYCVMKIDRKKPLIDYFEYLKEKLALHGIHIDESCKDVTRLRFFSYDENGYYNPKAKALKIPKPKKIKKPKTKSGKVSKSDLEKVEAVVSLIERNAIDITSDYYDWVKIAGALNNSFGDSGLSFFHRISSFHHAYNESKTTRKYESCAKMNKVSLSSFFYIADSYGIRY
jgi:hypothetical protein